MTETLISDLIARLQSIVEGGEPDKAGRGYVLNLLAEPARDHPGCASERVDT